MVRFGMKRVETSPSFSIFKKRTKKSHTVKNYMAFKILYKYYLFAAYNSETLFQLITLKKPPI